MRYWRAVLEEETHEATRGVAHREGTLLRSASEGVCRAIGEMRGNVEEIWGVGKQKCKVEIRELEGRVWGREQTSAIRRGGLRR